MAAQRAEVDTSRPFRSVKEAVAIFGERFLAGGLVLQSLQGPTTHKPALPSLSTAPSSSPAPTICRERRADAELVNAVRRLEAEVEETRRELGLLKERESEMQVVVACLNAELHRCINMSGKADSAAAAVTVSASNHKTSLAAEFGGQRMSCTSAASERYSWGFGLLMSLGEADDELRERKRMRRVKKKKKKMKKKKKKPIVSILSDACSWKRKPSPMTTLISYHKRHDPL